MEFLNKKATEVFSSLMDRLINGYVKIYNDPYMPLSMEKIGDEIQTSWGTAAIYSLCHYYEQNGDLMQDPEVCFLVIDEREGMSDTIAKLKVAAFSFRQANLGIYQESLLFADDKVKFYAKMQSEHADFANQWLTNIKEQGFLK